MKNYDIFTSAIPIDGIIIQLTSKQKINCSYALIHPENGKSFVVFWWNCVKSLYENETEINETVNPFNIRELHVLGDY